MKEFSARREWPDEARARHSTIGRPYGAPVQFTSGYRKRPAQQEG